MRALARPRAGQVWTMTYHRDRYYFRVSLVAKGRLSGRQVWGDFPALPYSGKIASYPVEGFMAQWKRVIA